MIIDYTPSHAADIYQPESVPGRTYTAIYEGKTSGKISILQISTVRRPFTGRILRSMSVNFIKFPLEYIIERVMYMDQIKTGKFIAEKRKELSLTQQELADILGISNKTVSKWECGNGLPDVSLMLPLCNTLHITVNELLSGEAVEDKYKEKAEENLIALIQEKQSGGPAVKNIIIWQTITLAAAVCIWFLLFADSNIYQLGQTPTPLTLCYLSAGFIAIYTSVMTVVYGIMKKNQTIIFLSLSFSSLVCLLICIGYKTFWLAVPAAAGVLLCFALSLRAFFRHKK